MQCTVHWPGKLPQGSSAACWMGSFLFCCKAYAAGAAAVFGLYHSCRHSCSGYTVWANNWFTGGVWCLHAVVGMCYISGSACSATACCQADITAAI